MPSATVPADAAPSGSASPRPTATSAPAPAGIEAIDFGNLEWFDAFEGRQVRLKQGRATVKATQYSLGTRETQFADADGDGDQDALVALFSEEGNGYADYTYVWLWDEAGQRPVQLRQPVTDDGRCGNVTTSIAVAPNLVTVTFLDRRKFDGNCAEKPDETSTRTIALTKGYLHQVTPQRTALTPCGPALSSEGYPPEELYGASLLAAPDAKAPAVVATEAIKVWDSATDQSGVPKGWLKVMYVPTKGAYDDADPPCGFVKISD